MYAISAVSGQIDVLLGIVPVKLALAIGDLSDEDKAQLQLVVDLREYARNDLNMVIKQSFSTFYDTGDEPLAYNLSASPPDRFEPLVWSFPLVPPMPYLGFFNVDQAVAFRDDLIADGYDTFLYEVTAYNAYGPLPDPISTAMLEADLIDLATVVFHELVHNTVYRTGDTAYNESAAVFISRLGTLEYLADTYGADSELIDEAIGRYTDEDLFTAWLDDLYIELNALYQSSESLQDTLANREVIIDQAREDFVSDVLPLIASPEMYGSVPDAKLNNALLLAWRRYHSEFDLFQAVHDATGNQFAPTLDVLIQAANAPNWRTFLTGWLGEQSSS